MRFPWQRRADEERRHRVDAERRLAATRADWTKVRDHTAELRRQKDLNGWTTVVTALFADDRGAK